MDKILRRYIVKKNTSLIRQFTKYLNIKKTTILVAAMLAFTEAANITADSVFQKAWTTEMSKARNVAALLSDYNGAHPVIANGRLVISGLEAAKDNQLIGCTPATQAAYDASRKHEPAITSMMVSIADKTGMELTGLEHSVKTASSITSKIERKLEDGLASIQATKYVESLHDVVRYTFVGDKKTLAANLHKSIDSLQANAYTIEEIDNKFLNKNNRYKAVHIKVRSPENQPFEIQFHSTEGRQAGIDTHEMYEEWRNPATSTARKDALFTQIKDIYDAVPLPDDIDKIESFSLAC